MQFLLDVNASGAVAEWLIQYGHDVVEVCHKDPRMSDNEILSGLSRKAGLLLPQTMILKK